MRPIRNLSIRHKLVVIIMTTSLAALLLACLGFISYERVTFRAKLAQDFWTLADVLDDSLAPGLAFTDPAALQQQLDTLKSHPHVLAAAVYDKTGQRVSAYERDRRARGFPWPAVAREGSFFQPERLDTIKAIPLAGEGSARSTSPRTWASWRHASSVTCSSRARCCCARGPNASSWRRSFCAASAWRPSAPWPAASPMT